MDSGWHDLGRHVHEAEFVLALCNGNRTDVFDQAQIGIINCERDLRLISQGAGQSVCAGRRKLGDQEDTQGQ